MEDSKYWIPLITSMLALAGTVYATLSNLRLARLNADLQAKRDELLAQRESLKTISRYRDPLMHAAYDLQSRIYNILRHNFLRRHYINGIEQEKQYAVENSVFLLAQFLGWTEAIREEIQFLDLQGDDQTKELRCLQDNIQARLRTEMLGKGFRLFAGEQRAIGELMLEPGAGGCRCIGFAKFIDARDRAIDRWLDPLREDIKQMAVDTTPFEPRLTEIQHCLIDLLAFLDPDYVRFPEHLRTKV